MLKIRQIKEEDAERYLSLLYELDNQTRFMLYEPGERTSTVEDIKNRINQALASDSLIVIAEDDEKVVGFISASRGQTKKINHIAYIVIGILKDYHGKGLGKMFFENVDHWALSKGIQRLELTVMVHNERAIRLYKKCGFQIEGTKQNAIMMDNKFFDEYYMAKLLNEQDLTMYLCKNKILENVAFRGGER